MALSTLIINADDFGMSSIINQAILASIDEGLVTSTSIMANMPGFEDALGLMRDHPYMRSRVGVHLNLTQGRPLSIPIQSFPLFCDADGSFCFARQHSLFRLSQKQQEAVYEELRTQLERVISAGIAPIHLDSHHHIHTEWAIAPLVRRLAREYNIPRIRLTRNMGHQPAYPKRVYKSIFNRWRLDHTPRLGTTDLFGDIRDMIHFSRQGLPNNKTIEIMVHPLFDESGGLVDLDHNDLRRQLEPILRQPVTLSPKPIEIRS
jgi:predicted glycoside hydrolase/deacetylase ChbG (UPF0249 family)